MYIKIKNIIINFFERIGTSSRSDFTKGLNTPGPGLYDTSKGLGGPRWGFGTDMRNKLNDKSENPGPGTYNIPPKFADVPKYLLPNGPKYQY